MQKYAQQMAEKVREEKQADKGDSSYESSERGNICDGKCSGI